MLHLRGNFKQINIILLPFKQEYDLFFLFSVYILSGNSFILLLILYLFIKTFESQRTEFTSKQKNGENTFILQGKLLNTVFFLKKISSPSKLSFMIAFYS